MSLVSVDAVCMISSRQATQGDRVSRSTYTLAADSAKTQSAVRRIQSGKQPVSTRRRHLKAQRKPQKAAVELRRGDVAYRPPPWQITYNTTAEALQTPEMIKVLDSQACSDSEVHVAIDVAPVGLGYFVNGTVTAKLPLQCDCCWAAFDHELEAPLKVWLDASLAADEMPEDPCQLPFPLEMQAIDLGPAINDAIMLALPSANLCGQPDCSIRAAEMQRSTGGTSTGWSASPATQNSKKKGASAVSKSGQFAALQELKSRA